MPGHLWYVRGRFSLPRIDTLVASKLSGSTGRGKDTGLTPARPLEPGHEQTFHQLKPKGGQIMNTKMVMFLLLVAVMVFGNCDASGQYVWTKDSHNPVFVGAGSGAWDNSVEVPWVIFNSDSARYEMWYTSGGSVGSIGFAVSSDGITWKRDANPVLSTSPGKWDSYFVGVPSVIRENGQYKMWYTGAQGPSGGIEVAANRIGYATSPDGRTWAKYSGNPVLGPGTSAWESGGVEYCSVIKSPGGYEMFYDGFTPTLTLIGRATSVDGIAWQRDTVHNPVLNKGGVGAWDGNVYLPRVLSLGDKYYMWYTAEALPGGGSSKIGVATSGDSGKTWVRYAQNPVLTLGSSGSWEDTWIELGTVLPVGKTFHMWYDGGSANIGRVGHATSTITSGWLAQTSGTTNDLYRISFTDGNTGTIAGASGTILRTTNAGTAWTSQGSGTVNNLFGVSFWDSMNGWIAGDNGTILHTTTGGASWSPQATGRTVALWDVFSTDINTATAVGDLGTILHTTNGGATWGPQTSGVNRKLEALFFMNSIVGIAVGDTGMILRTTNGGATWNIQASGTSNDLLELSFSDVNTGTIVGTSGTILRTTNAGVTWTSQTSGTTGTIWDVGFTSRMEGTVVGQAGMIFRTTDGGQTWKHQVSGTTNTLFTVCFTSSLNGIAAGAAGTILSTTTSGYTGVKDNPPSLAVVPHDFTLLQNFPNPFNLQLHKIEEPPAICQRLPCSGGRNIPIPTTLEHIAEVEIG